MRFIGFNFTKISAEKHSDNFKELKINNNIDISEIKPVKNDILKQKEELVALKFKYGVDYSKDVAQIQIEGNILMALDQKESKDIIRQWKDKKIPENLRAPIFNLIMKKSDIKALSLEDELNLPLHMSLRMVKNQ